VLPSSSHRLQVGSHLDSCIPKFKSAEEDGTVRVRRAQASRYEPRTQRSHASSKRAEENASARPDCPDRRRFGDDVVGVTWREMQLAHLGIEPGVQTDHALGRRRPGCCVALWSRTAARIGDATIWRSTTRLIAKRPNLSHTLGRATRRTGWPTPGQGSLHAPRAVPSPLGLRLGEMGCQVGAIAQDLVELLGL